MADELRFLCTSNDSRSYTMASNILFLNIAKRSGSDDKAADTLREITLNNSNTAVIALKLLSMIKSNRSSSVTMDKTHNLVRPSETLIHSTLLHRTVLVDLMTQCVLSHLPWLHLTVSVDLFTHWMHTHFPSSMAPPH